MTSPFVVYEDDIFDRRKKRKLAANTKIKEIKCI